jgi:hypothetical protein
MEIYTKDKYRNIKNMGMENLNLKMVVSMKEISFKDKFKAMEYIMLMGFLRQLEFGIKASTWAKTIR